MSKTRDLRLREDKKKLDKMAQSCGYLTIQPLKGNPPSAYMLTFSLTGYIDASGKKGNSHQVKLTLPARYPIHEAPKFQFVKKLWHPNVYANGDVCLGLTSRWNPGFIITELVLDIAKYICFKEDSYNLSSLANSRCNATWIAAHPVPVDHTNIFFEDKPAIVVKEKKLNISIKEAPANLQDKIKIRINHGTKNKN